MPFLRSAVRPALVALMALALLLGMSVTGAPRGGQHEAATVRPAAAPQNLTAEKSAPVAKPQLRKAAFGIVTTRETRLNVRSGPGIKYQRIGALSHGHRVKVRCLAYSAETHTGPLGPSRAWANIGTERWVSAAFLRIEGGPVAKCSAGKRPVIRAGSYRVPRSETASSPSATRAGTYSTARRRVVAYALAQLGKPYLWGGAGPRAFDCSGLTMRAWQRAGVHLPHFTGAQIRAGSRITRGRLLPGDLVFTNGGRHVKLYIGHGKVVHAPRTGTRVRIDPLPIRGVVAYITVLRR